MKTPAHFLFAVAWLLTTPGCADAPSQPAEDTPHATADEQPLEPGTPQPPPPVLTDPSDLDAHVGQLITLRGEVFNAKIPTILGVDVESNDPDLRGQQAQATGILQRHVVTPEDIVNANYAHRGAGVFYRLKDSDTNYAAAVRPVPPPPTDADPDRTQAP